MIIRDFEPRDFVKMRELLEENKLPVGCMPDLVVENHIGRKQKNPLFVVKRVFEHEGATAMLCFLKVRSELYFFIDHKIGTPELRRDWLRVVTDDMRQEALKLGIDQMTAFVPPEIDESFSKRLTDLGFKKSRWVPYSMNL